MSQSPPARRFVPRTVDSRAAPRGNFVSGIVAPGHDSAAFLDPWDSPVRLERAIGDAPSILAVVGLDDDAGGAGHAEAAGETVAGNFPRTGWCGGHADVYNSAR